MKNSHRGNSVSPRFRLGDAIPVPQLQLLIRQDHLQHSREAEGRDWSSQFWGHQYLRDWNMREQAQGEGCEEGLGICHEERLGEVGSPSLEEVEGSQQRV